MLVVGVRSCGSDMDEDRGRQRLGEVRFFLDLGFEREQSR